MRAVVFAYHDIGVIGLEQLHCHGVEIALVLSHPDDANEECWFASVVDWCRERGVPCERPHNANLAPWPDRVAACRPDILFSFFYRRLLSRELLQTAPRGGLNLHASLLPAYRGRCPANWVLVRGESQTGVTLHHMSEQADAGDIVGQIPVPISSQDDIVSLYTRLKTAAEVLLEAWLPAIIEDRAPRRSQDESGATTFGRRSPDDGLIDWSRSARELYNLVRAVTSPYPGAFTYLEGRRLTLWRVAVVAGVHPDCVIGALRIIDQEVVVGCGEGALKLLDLSWGEHRSRGPDVAQLLHDWDHTRFVTG
ncbi:MAG: hypothetical protein HQ523_03650 [Lentisphaerae bacterium]|nr:hypothetical protein [Lentisphaerota bacterium]